MTATWSEFARSAPELASIGARLFDEHRLAYLATVQSNGSPRLHPVTPVRTDLGVYVAVNEQSPKRWDLERNGRYALHAPLGEQDTEFVITGRVKRVRNDAERRAVQEAAGHVIHDTDWIFEFQIARCLQAYWVNAGQPGTYPIRCRWQADNAE